MQINSSLLATILVAKLLNSSIKDAIRVLETVLHFGSMSTLNSTGIFSMGNSLSHFLMAVYQISIGISSF